MKALSRQIFLLITASLVLFSCSTKILTDARDARRKEVRGNLKERYAAVLNVDKKEIRNEKLYHFIDNWMGVPHRDGGMDKRGVDCSGFTSLLARDIYNLSLPRVAAQMADRVKRKYEDELKEGDLVFFDFNGRKFTHVGVYLANNKFVHASTSKGVIISDLKDPWYYKYFSRAGSIIK